MIKNKNNQNNNTKIISVIIFVLIVVALVMICIFLKPNGKKEYKTIKLPFTSGIEKLENFDGNDYYKIGWLQVQGTNIDLPIMESSYRDFMEEKENAPSFGWLSALYTTGENREVLGGHNILNVSDKPLLPNKNLTDFEELMAFTYYDFAKDNLYIQYTKDGKDEIYLIYAVGFYNSSQESTASISDDKKLTEYIKRTRETSIYDYDVDVKSSDYLIQLATCTRYFGYNEKRSFMIDARKLRDGEKIVKYDVTKNKNYEMLEKKEEKM